MRKKCIDCSHRATDCAQGLMTLPLKDLIIWCKAVKKRTGVTNNQIAEKSGIPFGTIERIMAGKAEDAKFSTIQAIINVLLEYTPGVTCPDDDALSAAHLRQRLTELAHVEEEKEKLEQHLTHLQEVHAKEMEAVRADNQLCATYLQEHTANDKARSKRFFLALIILGVFDILTIAIAFLT